MADTSAQGTIVATAKRRDWISEDGASTWREVLDYEERFPPIVGGYYLGTGEPDKYPVCQDASIPGRRYRGFFDLKRSGDGGRTWSVVGFDKAKPIVTNVFKQIACRGNALVVQFGSEFSRTSDAGASSWTTLPLPTTGPPGAREATFSRVAFDGGRLLAIVYYDGVSVLHASSDLGTSWTPPLFTFPAGFAVDIVSAGGGRLVALIAVALDPDDLSPTRQVRYTPWFSSDGGLSFVERPEGALTSTTKVRLESDVLRPERVLATGAGQVRVSTDGGAIWRPAAGLTPSQEPLYATWVRPAPSGGASFVVATADRGILRTDDGGTTFLPVNRGLPGARLGTLAAAVHQGERYELSSSLMGWSEEFDDSPGQHRRGSDGNRWVRGVNTGMVARSPLEGNVLVSGFGQRSTDAGATWTGSAPGGSIRLRYTTVDGVADSPIAWASLVPFGFSADPGYVALLGANTTGRLPLGEPPPFTSLYDIGAAAVAASAPNTIYVADRGFYQSGVPPSVLRSTDQGVTFALRTLPLPGSGVVELKVDLNDANRLLAVPRNGNVVYESFDGAGAWTSLPAIVGATLVYTLTVEANTTPRRLYAGTDDGVFLLVGNAPTWQRVGASNGWRVSSILVDGPPDRRTLTLATDRGVWELTQDTAAATIPVYRFYNTQTRTHFYTASQAERDHVLATWPHFIPEGIAFHAVKADRTSVGIPVWRFFNTQTGTHFYTSSPAERAHVLATWPQFVEEGVVYRALAATEPGTVKLFRFFNTETGAHFTTTEDDERDFVNSRLPMFVDEGPTYSVYPAAPGG